ncbi:hypothetical protein GCM10011409_18780 [Lentibacillus populi]|uniref:Uncharacterized protein n=1 Tax=Lentibacillus populi TaxID=1827502 RepID=A0A9W5TXP9_9BACI|nr:hypothetical protein [Lentibacillus populi]GGB41501.1 hypothetical protein GCM10011409_18780 [Lentibacillus populi]
MKAFEAEENIMVKHIIDQLHQLGYYETAGKSKRELITKLAAKRAVEVRVEDPGSGWF